ncbi:M24 family metallopeptidase [Steroidobacter gossypii]|uniref:M24 family metallopeptidase n=1 Tax=Steroidobacter gossypii TaxID=2805490 RepID=UPI00193323E0|nr:aminopeptidase P family protein [Steroidobacter gossypii]
MAHDHVCELQPWLRGRDLSGLLVPSTDEFLSEFAPPSQRRLRWATGFRGSTGLAIILRDAAALFLDGRYRLQAEVETEGAAIAIEPATLEARRIWLRRFLSPGARLALDPWLHSQPDVAQWQSLAAELGFNLQMLDENPIDALWGPSRPAEYRPKIVDYPVRFSGETYQVRCARVTEHLRRSGLHALLVADPEDVSWLLNVRAAVEAHWTPAGEWHIVPSCTTRALVRKDGRVTWFVDEDRLSKNVLARGQGPVVVQSSDRLTRALSEAAQQGLVGANLQRTPFALTAILRESARDDDAVARLRWHKHPAELEGARRAHIIDAAAVVRFAAWLARTVPEHAVSEFEAAQKLESLRAEHADYRGPSMPLMSASGPSGAQPHYVPPQEGSRVLNDHAIYWMDSGGHYPGGTTDNTLTIALGTPKPRHVLAHTLVLKAYVALARARFPSGTPAFRLDTIARQQLWNEGLDYDHGTGHGVGNYLNIHEGPVIRAEVRPISAYPLEPGMIITNEPGYYVDRDFGVRIESHMIVVPSRYSNFLEFDTISRLPIDPRLVDLERLSPTERHWLGEYHRTVLRDIEPLLDVQSAAWLRTFVQPFIEY